MNIRQQTSDCRVISIASGSAIRTAEPSTLLDLIHGQHAMNLAELADSIRADRNFCNVVTEAASQEFGWPELKVEDAIVLLGGKRLCNLASAPVPGGRPAIKSRRTFHNNSFTPSANLSLLETIQEEPK